MGVQLINNLPFMLSSGYSNDNIWLTVHKRVAKKKGTSELLRNKMDGYTSLPLSHNKICDSRRANKDCRKDCVCRYCYSYIQASIHPSIRTKMDHNSVTLSNVGYIPKLIHTINNKLRYISFGDVSSSVQAINILKHARLNKHLDKAIWTKMYGYFNQELNKKSSINKPIKNLNLIWSCSKLNCLNFIIPKHFTKSFYVYTDNKTLIEARRKAKEKGYKVIECSQQCNDCNHCYENHENTIVMELLRIGKGSVKL